MAENTMANCGDKPHLETGFWALVAAERKKARPTRGWVSPPRIGDPESHQNLMYEITLHLKHQKAFEKINGWNNFMFFC